MFAVQNGTTMYAGMRVMASTLLLHAGDMPQAFDGGGLGATPSATRFGMQMSPHNAETRQVSHLTRPVLTRCCIYDVDL